MDSLLIWAGAGLLVLGIFLPYLARFRRRRRADRARLREAAALGLDRPLGQYPQIDIHRCIGCGTCVQACPEGDVLGIVDGKAVVINGARCVGHGRCEEVCCVGAIRVGLGDIRRRADIPLLSDELETSVPGVFIAGELGGFGLISNAVAQGVRAAAAVAARCAVAGGGEGLDLIVVGAGPAGLAAALAARERGLDFLVLDQQEPGGTILQYPRRKLVMVQPLELPLHGRLAAREYAKEELLEIWQEILQRQGLPIRTGERVAQVRRQEGGPLLVITSKGTLSARHVILALGRRGTPRRLGVPGEELPKVAYQLVDAASYRNRRLLVVGGGDSAVEAALALARQSGNEVTLSYRKPKLARIRKANLDRLEGHLREGSIRFLGESQVTAIAEQEVRLATPGGELVLPNDDVFVCAGGVPPFDLLRESGIVFGGAQRDPAPVARP